MKNLININLLIYVFKELLFYNNIMTKSILFIITSIIDIPNIPLNYSLIRSVFTRDERFEQTKITIESIKIKNPEAKIMIVECSNYENNKKELEYLRENTDYFLNLWENKGLYQYIFGSSKTIGVEVMTIELINFIIKNNLNFDNNFFISGRYYLNSNYSNDSYINSKIIKFKSNNLYTSTRLYKLPNKYLSIYKDYLFNNLNPNLSYEDIYNNFCELYKDDILEFDETIVSGLIAVDGNKIN